MSWLMHARLLIGLIDSHLCAMGGVHTSAERQPTRRNTEGGIEGMTNAKACVAEDAEYYMFGACSADFNF